ncbi:MAG: hypothetical protein H7Z41_09550 [Cytophagales bacterium]|nr:hypothetical protein [Armatimonadota bacterium]
MNEKKDETPGPVSRRDFLRRAGKEAVETGTSLVPGARLATAALGRKTADGKPNWWQKLAQWRQGRGGEARTEDTAGDTGL